jgi:hypothetical protein
MEVLSMLPAKSPMSCLPQGNCLELAMLARVDAGGN